MTHLNRQIVALTLGLSLPIGGVVFGLYLLATSLGL